MPGAGAQMRYEQEKKDMEELRALQKKREELRVKLKEAEARYDLAMVADLKCAPVSLQTSSYMLFLRPCTFTLPR